jgi:hypothetical protein
MVVDSDSLAKEPKHMCVYGVEFILLVMTLQGWKYGNISKNLSISIQVCEQAKYWHGPKTLFMRTRKSLCVPGLMDWREKIKWTPRMKKNVHHRWVSGCPVWTCILCNDSGGSQHIPDNVKHLHIPILVCSSSIRWVLSSPTLPCCGTMNQVGQHGIGLLGTSGLSWFNGTNLLVSLLRPQPFYT